MLTRYVGTVSIVSNGYWVLQDDDPQAWAGPIESDFAGTMGQDGIYLISGHWAGDIRVTVDVYDSRPSKPQNWVKSVELDAEFPSRLGAAYCQQLRPTAELAAIVMPAALVTARISVNGWVSPPMVDTPPEEWLIEIWPALPT